MIVGGSWSAYWYNGRIYSSDIQKGFDVLAVTDPLFVFAGLVSRPGTGNFTGRTHV